MSPLIAGGGVTIGSSELLSGALAVVDELLTVAEELLTVVDELLTVVDELLCTEELLLCCGRLTEPPVPSGFGGTISLYELLELFEELSDELLCGMSATLDDDENSDELAALDEISPETPKLFEE